MPKLPGGELASRPLHFIWIADCSGSMGVDGKIQQLNFAIRDAIPHMQKVAEDNPNAAVLVRAINFPTAPSGISPSRRRLRNSSGSTWKRWELPIWEWR